MIFSCIPKLNSCKVVCFFGKIEIVLMYECQTLCFVVIGRGLSITLTASDNKQNHMLITSWYLMISEWGHTKNFLCLLMCVSDFFLTLNSLFHENLVLWYFYNWYSDIFYDWYAQLRCHFINQVHLKKIWWIKCKIKRIWSKSAFFW